MNRILDEKNDMRSKLREMELLSSDFAFKQLQCWPVFTEVQKVAFYLAMTDEINLEDLFDTDKELYLPRFERGDYKMSQVRSRDDLVVGKFGILEPMADCPDALPGQIEFWLVPGRAFDEFGNRLGRGRGFYDRLLKSEPGVKVGLPPDGKVSDRVPVDEWDVKMDFLLLEDGISKVK